MENINDAGIIEMCINAKKKYGILVGVNNVSMQSVKNLRGCINDVIFLADFLSPEYHLQCLTDEPHNKKPTRHSILDAFKHVLKKASGNDTVLFYFSGHAIKYNGKCALITHDGQSISQLVFQKLVRLYLKKGTKLFFILDSCHSGNFLDLNYKYTNGKICDIKEKLHADIRRSIVSLSSCSVEEKSFDKLIDKTHQSVLSWAFLTSIKKIKKNTTREIYTSLIVQLQLQTQGSSPLPHMYFSEKRHDIFNALIF